MNYKIIILIVLIGLLLFLFTAMVHRYCVKMEFKWLGCNIKFDLQPHSLHSDSPNITSTSGMNKKTKK